jgi:hypothetical protein
MKPRVGVYLSEGMASRLSAIARDPKVTKSAVVETALEHFLDLDIAVDRSSVNERLDAISHQIEQLGHDLRIVSEAVALQSRFHLAVTPPLSPAAQREACKLGSERFDEFAAQVARRVDRKASLMRETIERVGEQKQQAIAIALEDEPRAHAAVFHTEFSSTANPTGNRSSRPAAVREDGSSRHFPDQTGCPSH